MNKALDAELPRVQVGERSSGALKHCMAKGDSWKIG